MPFKWKPKSIKSREEKETNFASWKRRRATRKQTMRKRPADPNADGLPGIRFQQGRVVKASLARPPLVRRWPRRLRLFSANNAIRWVLRHRRSSKTQSRSLSLQLKTLAFLHRRRGTTRRARTKRSRRNEEEPRFNDNALRFVLWWQALDGWIYRFRDNALRFVLWRQAFLL